MSDVIGLNNLLESIKLGPNWKATRKKINVRAWRILFITINFQSNEDLCNSKSVTYTATDPKTNSAKPLERAPHKMGCQGISLSHLDG